MPDGTRKEQQAEGGAEGEERAQGRSQRGRARALRKRRRCYEVAAGLKEVGLGAQRAGGV